MVGRFDAVHTTPGKIHQPIGTVKLRWFGPYTRFENLSRDEYSQPF